MEGYRLEVTTRSSMSFQGSRYGSSSATGSLERISSQAVILTNPHLTSKQESTSRFNLAINHFH